MGLATTADVRWNGLKVVAEAQPESDQRDRIIEALGSVGQIPRVHEEPLSRYYKYLKKHLDFPFLAHYPKPATFQEEEGSSAPCWSYSTPRNTWATGVTVSSARREEENTS